MKRSTSSALLSSRSGTYATVMSDRALALAADDPVGIGAVPVDELRHRLQGERRREGEVGLDELFELRRAHAAHELVELLAVDAVVLVVADPALDGLGHALGGQPDLQALAVDHVAALVVAREVGDVGRHGVLADLDRRAVEPD